MLGGHHPVRCITVMPQDLGGIGFIGTEDYNGLAALISTGPHRHLRGGERFRMSKTRIQEAMVNSWQFQHRPDRSKFSLMLCRSAKAQSCCRGNGSASLKKVLNNC